MTITIDGTKAKHDLQRVFPDGTGSYDVVKKNVDVWKNQFYASTKVTFASADLKYLKDSIIELWQEGIPEIAANVVFEDVWKEDDDKIFEEQKSILADKKNKLDAGMVSKYDYYNIQYNYLTQELGNIQLGFKSFISEVDFIYNLGGQNGTGKK